MTFAERYFCLIPLKDFLLQWKKWFAAHRMQNFLAHPVQLCCTKSLWRAEYFWGFHLRPGPMIFPMEVALRAVFRF